MSSIANSQSPLEAALAALGIGWWVLPLHSMRDGHCTCGQANDADKHKPGKHPRTAHGLTDASNKPDQVKAWWAQWPDANVGVACGPSALYVLDVDPRNGGEATLKALLARVGEEVMDTVRQETGGGGLQVLWDRRGLDERNTTGTADGGLGPGIDTRGVGGYIIIPPSSHVSGGTYRWVRGRAPGEHALLPLPQRIVDELQKARDAKRNRTPTQEVLAVEKGGRNHALASKAGSMHRARFPVPAIMAAVKEYNRTQCKPPLPDREVDQIVRSITRYPAGPIADVVLEASPDDVGNGERLAALFGDDLRYVYEWKGWAVWDGRCWTRDVHGRVQECGKATARALLEAALRLPEDNPDDPKASRRQRMLKFANRSHSASAIEQMIKMANSALGIRIQADRFDTHPGLLNVRNGVLGLRAGKLQEHSRDLYLTSFTDIDYDPAATCPLWDWFVDQCTMGDKELAAFLQLCVGYTLTGYVKEEVLFFLYGNGQNGKSKFINMVRRLLGDLACTLTLGMLAETRESRTEGAVADLIGKRMATSIDSINEGRSFNESLLKGLTGGDLGIKGRQIYERAQEFDMQAKIWLSNNYKPEVRGTDDGIWRRIIPIPFQNHVLDEKRDDELEAKLVKELPGILAWAVRGSMQWFGSDGTDGRPPAAPKRIKTNLPAKVREALADYRSESDSFGRFLEETCTIDENLAVAAADLLKAHHAWAEEGNERKLTANALGRRMKQQRAGLFKSEKRHGVNYWVGLGLGRVKPPPSQGTLDPAKAAFLQQVDGAVAAAVAGQDLEDAIMDLVARVAREDEKGICTGSRIEQELVNRWPVGQIQHKLRVLVQLKGRLYCKLGADTYAPVHSSPNLALAEATAS